jgi:hypothetical protein
VTNGQIEQLQELSRCWMPRHDIKALGHDARYLEELSYWDATEHLGKAQKRVLRRLTYQYRHQIKAMKHNR